MPFSAGPVPNVPPDESLGWTLNECIYRLDGIGGMGLDHRMLVIADPSDNMVAQINGLASEWDGKLARWVPVPIGYLSRHRLRVYVSGYWVWKNGQIEVRRERPQLLGALRVAGTDGRLRANLSKARQKGLVDVIKGMGGNSSEASLLGFVSKGLKLATRLNAIGNKDPRAVGLPYPRMGLGANSNTIIHSLRVAMGFKGAPKSFGGNAPFYERLLLRPEQLARLDDNSETIPDEI